MIRFTSSFKPTALPLCLLIIAGSAIASEQPTKPNILYINADDLGVMDVSFMGDRRYHTPNLKKLASEGMVFTNAYAPAANCAPSRAACLSGQAAPRSGVYTVGNSTRGHTKTRKLIPTTNKKVLSNDCITLADEMKRSGYVTCQIGKWHVGNDPTKQGIDINIGGWEAGGPRSYFSPYRNPQLNDGPKGEYLTDRLTHEAIRFLTEHKNQPFFLYLPYYAVHTPLQARQDLLKKYQGKPGIDPVYAAMIEGLDENIGRLLKHLQDSGLAKNTVVVFSSDNGGIRNISPQDPWRAGKGSYYEGGIRVPLTIRWPGKIAPGSSCEVPVTGLDLYPTLLDAIGATPASGKTIDGLSLLPLLQQSGSIKERALYWHFPIYLQKYGDDDARDSLFRTRPGSVIQFSHWKLHEYFEHGEIELYDLRSDNGERNNLAKKMPEKSRELLKMLNDWRAKLNAPVPTELNPKYDPSFEKRAMKSTLNKKLHRGSTGATDQKG
ncbi:MAG: sulfatase [Verrucomicrobiae bacterium]|nr:sulfatase [Verrucomicrobiae bacterium]NNJ42177.1 sulfatase [Akkermansiaceae bacterium]